MFQIPLGFETLKQKAGVIVAARARSTSLQLPILDCTYSIPDLEGDFNGEMQNLPDCAAKNLCRLLCILAKDRVAAAGLPAGRRRAKREPGRPERPPR